MELILKFLNENQSLIEIASLVISVVTLCANKKMITVF